MFPRTLMNVATLPLFVLGCILLISRKVKGPSKMQLACMGTVVGCFFLFYLLEIFVIRTDHDYYLLPIVPFLVIPSAISSSRILSVNGILLKVVVILLLALVPYMTYRRIHPRWRPENAEYNRDLSIHLNSLRLAAPDSALVVAGPDASHLIFLYYIHKKGWSWDKKKPFGPEELKAFRDKGAEYFYCDDRSYDSLPEIKSLLEEELGQFGSVKVYRLR